MCTHSFYRFATAKLSTFLSGLELTRSCGRTFLQTEVSSQLCKCESADSCHNKLALRESPVSSDSSNFITPYRGGGSADEPHQKRGPPVYLKAGVTLPQFSELPINRHNHSLRSVGQQFLGSPAFVQSAVDVLQESEKRLFSFASCVRQFPEDKLLDETRSDACTCVDREICEHHVGTSVRFRIVDVGDSGRCQITT